MSFRLLTATDRRKNGLGSAALLECPSIPLNPIPIYLPQVFQSSRRGRKLARWRILRRGGTGNSLSHTSNRNCFPSEPYGMRICEVAQCILPPPSSVLSRKVFPHAGFWATRPDGGGKTSLCAVDVYVGVDVGASASASRASATRASFLFCRNYFPGRAFCLISAPCHFLFVGAVVLSSFYEKRSVPASLRKLFNSWRKYDTSESSFRERARKCFLSAFLASRSLGRPVSLREIVEATYRTPVEI